MSNKKKIISISSSCYNEEGNLPEWYERLVKIFKQFPQYDYEIIIADNCSTDGTREILRRIASNDKNFKVILNSNNFGPICSTYNAMLQTTGDAVISMASDLQDPPEVIPELISKWESGFQVVVAVKPKSRENLPMSLVRKFYYLLLSYISDSNIIIRNFTGFGLYNRKFMDALKRYPDAYPYFRGLVGEIGFKRAEIEYIQDKRKHGISKINFLELYGVAMTGFVNHSKLPLRLATFSGFCLSVVSLMIALAYFIYKLLYWDTFTLGLAPLVIGLFFFSAMQLIFIGIIGEYVGAILTQVKNHPLAIEDEKLNFKDTP
ncbi:MAG: glycosyltransferase family 2 protein [Victivallales bacterium]